MAKYVEQRAGVYISSSMIPPTGELPDRKLAGEAIKKNPYPAWFWLFVIGVLVMLAWGISSWYTTSMAEKRSHSPFLKVTNRQFSLFLWENPEFMRINASNKSGYLPGFQYLKKVSLEPELAEEQVVAPPEVIFRYHTWNRLLQPEFIARAIPNEEFMEFLNYASEWHPKNWPQATEDYFAFIRSLPTMGATEDLSRLPLTSLPLEVREAFLGWKNYIKEGEAINNVKVTYAELRDFLLAHPNYARNYWRNIVAKKEPNYLKALSLGNVSPEAEVPADQLSAFLKVALYNAQQAAKEKPEK
jgi:hypothetical protein